MYFLLRPRFGTETLSWVCILGTFPFAAIAGYRGSLTLIEDLFDNY